MATSNTVNTPITTDGAALMGTASKIAALEYQVNGTTITTATVAASDLVMIQDADDSSSLKTVTVSAIAALVGTGITWSTIAGTTQSAVINNGYVVGNAAQTTITLPAVFSVGDRVIIKGLGAGGWILTAAAGDTIQLGQSATSAGGTLTSVANYNTVAVTCIVDNTTWSVDYALSSGLTTA